MPQMRGCLVPPALAESLGACTTQRHARNTRIQAAAVLPPSTDCQLLTLHLQDCSGCNTPCHPQGESAPTQSKTAACAHSIRPPCTQHFMSGIGRPALQPHELTLDAVVAVGHLKPSILQGALDAVLD